MRILVTGGAGFIGSHTADALLDEGHEVRVLDDLLPPVHPDGKKPGYLDERIEFVRGDVRDETKLLPALQGCDAVFHFAAFQDYLPTFSRYFDVNVTSTALIYELILREKLPIKKVIVASSQAALGEGAYEDAGGARVLPDMRPDSQLAQGEWEIQAPPGFEGPLRWIPTDESVANPQNQYGISKIAAEQVTLNLGRRYEIPSVALRYSIVQGPRQSFFNAYSGACRVFCLSFHQGKDPIIYEDGQQVRDFVNIEDVVRANVLVLLDPRADFEAFHIGGDKAVTVAEFAGVVAEVFGVKDFEPRASGQYRFGDTRHIYSDVRMLRALGGSPQKSGHDSVVAYKRWLDEADSVGDIVRYCNRQMASLNVVLQVKP